jgi:2'-5' RNA ligase
VSQSAFIVRVPEAEPHVAALRDRHDPSARLGVPAHLTLLHPFMSVGRIDATVLTAVRAIAQAQRPFAFRLATIGRFPGTVNLAPEPAAPFVELTLALVRAFPDHPACAGRHADIVPHLTVARADGAGADAAEAELRAKLPLPVGILASCRNHVDRELERTLATPACLRARRRRRGALIRARARTPERPNARTPEREQNRLRRPTSGKLGRRAEEQTWRASKASSSATSGTAKATERRS